MSVNEVTGAPKGVRTGWSEHEILVCLLNAIECSGTKLDFVNIAYPPGRTASGFTQKLTALKKALKPELDAINNGTALPDTATVTPEKAAAGRKRKVKDDEANGEESPTKKSRAKKNTAEPKSEATVKDEPESEPDFEEDI